MRAHNGLSRRHLLKWPARPAASLWPATSRGRRRQSASSRSTRRSTRSSTSPSRSRNWRPASAARRAHRRPAVVEGRRLSPVQRHPQQPAHQVHAGAGRDPVQPGADQPRQRPHPRHAGPADRLRARHPARHAARARRQPHRDRQQLPGPAPQPAQRRDREVRRLIYFTDPNDNIVPEQWDLTFPACTASRPISAP